MRLTPFASTARPAKLDLPTLLTTALILTLGLMGATLGAAPRLHALSPDQRAAMQWVADNTPTHSRFAIVSAAPWWDFVTVTDWFPVLACRASFVTSQGREWLGDYNSTDALAAGLQLCANRDAACVERWAAANNLTFTHCS